MGPGLSPISEILALLPEIILITGVCLVLVCPVLPPLRESFRQSRRTVTAIALIALIGALFASISMLAGWFGLTVPDHQVLYGMLAVDSFALSVKIIIYTFSIFVILLWAGVTAEDVRINDGPDFVALLLSGVMGMGLMASAANFLAVFLAIEAASIPCYALVGFNKKGRTSAEASLKYVLIGAVSSAIMVYGLSMLYGADGTLDLVKIAQNFGTNGMSPGLMMGLFGFAVGVGFKLSAVPIHFWCPDVFEGASIEITTLLSVASKAGAIALLTRIIMTLGYYSTSATHGQLVGVAAFIGIMGLVTATWGNLAAFFQTNFTRLLAYSSIAHAGYMMMAAGLMTAAMDRTQPSALAYAILFYLCVYAFMNLGAFSMAGVIAKWSGSQSMDKMAGMARHSPLVTAALCTVLLSLFGMPLTGGFWAKVRIGFEMFDQKMVFLVVGLVINTVFSLYFYLKPIYIMIWKDGDSRRPALQLRPVLTFIIAISIFGVMATGIIPDPITNWANDNANIVFAGEPITTSSSTVLQDSGQSPASVPTVKLAQGFSASANDAAVTKENR